MRYIDLGFAQPAAPLADSAGMWSPTQCWIRCAGCAQHSWISGISAICMWLGLVVHAGGLVVGGTGGCALGVGVSRRLRRLRWP